MVFTNLFHTIYIILLIALFGTLQSDGAIPLNSLPLSSGAIVQSGSSIEENAVNAGHTDTVKVEHLQSTTIISSSILLRGGESSESSSLKPQLTKLISRMDLTAEEAEDAWDQILAGSAPASVGALLALLRAKGETPVEISGMVRSMRKVCVPVFVPAENDGESAADKNACCNVKLLDIVGTGGDGADTINISTASIVLAAACGCKVAKAGNRSVSSRCGSADVLESLGVAIDLSAEQVAACIQSCGIGFLYAPVNHPAMKKVAPIRKTLGIRTAFNMLGPITNAAKADRVVIGVFHEELVDLIGGALVQLADIEHGVIIHGCGLDEISPLGPSTIFEIRNTAAAGQPKKYNTKKYKFDPRNIGIPRCTLEDLRGGDCEQNAQALLDVLSANLIEANIAAADSSASAAAAAVAPVDDVVLRKFEAKRNAIILNAGTGLYVYGLAGSIKEGVDICRRTLESGAARVKLEEWIKVTQSLKKSKLAEAKRSWFNWS